MLRYRVRVYKIHSQIVYTNFFDESRENEMAYLLGCISNSLNSLGYRIEAEKCL